MPADLFAPVMRLPVAPAGRAGPRLWIRRLAIFNDLNTIIRDVSLKPGLNIVWTPDMSSSGSRALAHGSGKTSFCRLLRGCLGEPNLATDRQRARIFAKFPLGFAAAEIIIDGVCWVAVRPFGMPGAEFVVESESIESAIARRRQDGDPALIDPVLIDTFLSRIADVSPPDVGREQVWDVLRAWLTRDQECRLADILEWRSSQTQSRSRAQVIGETAKLTMVRLALRALDAEEQTAAKRERELMIAAEAERERLAYEQQRFLDDLKSARSALNASDDTGLSDTLDQKRLVSLAEAALADAMRAVLPDSPSVSEIFAQLSTLNAERRTLETRQQDFSNSAAKKRTEAAARLAEANLGEIDLTQEGIRVCPVCRVGVDAALANGCGISLDPCNLSERRAEIEEKRTAAAELTSEALYAEQEAVATGALIDLLKPREAELAAQVAAADLASRRAQSSARAVQDRVYRARRILDDVRTLRDAAASPQPTKSMSTELEAARAELDAGRSRARAAIRSLEEIYQGIMSAWLPDGVAGTVRLDGHGLKVDAQFSGRGEVSTAALDSLKIVAFDLAALHLAVEEKADLPAFLIHDSPREADLDGQLYERLFELVHRWEKSAVVPCFQYIVTTTTAPPLALRTSDYVRLEMSSTPATARLFGTDL